MQSLLRASESAAKVEAGQLERLSDGVASKAKEHMASVNASLKQAHDLQQQVGVEGSKCGRFELVWGSSTCCCWDRCVWLVTGGQ